MVDIAQTQVVKHRNGLVQSGFFKDTFILFAAPTQEVISVHTTLSKSGVKLAHDAHGLLLKGRNGRVLTKKPIEGVKIKLPVEEKVETHIPENFRESCYFEKRGALLIGNENLEQLLDPWKKNCSILRVRDKASEYTPWQEYIVHYTSGKVSGSGANMEPVAIPRQSQQDVDIMRPVEELFFRGWVDHDGVITVEDRSGRSKRYTPLLAEWMVTGNKT